MAQRATIVAAAKLRGGAAVNIGGNRTITSIAAVYDVDPDSGSPWFVPMVQIAGTDTLAGGAGQTELNYGADTQVSIGDEISGPITNQAAGWYVVGRDSITAAPGAPSASLNVSAHRISITGALIPGGETADDATGVTVLWSAGEDAS